MGLVQYLRVKEMSPEQRRSERYKREADPQLAQALFDSIRTDDKQVPIEESDWAKTVARIKEQEPLKPPKKPAATKPRRKATKTASTKRASKTKAARKRSH